MADQAGMMAVNRAVEALADDPAPPGAFVRGAYRRLRVGPYRVLYEVEGDLITIVRINRVKAAAHRFEQLTDDLDPASVDAEDRSDLRAVAEAAENRSAAMRPSSRPANRLFPQLSGTTRPRLAAGSSRIRPTHGPRIAADGLMNRCPADRG